MIGELENDIFFDVQRDALSRNEVGVRKIVVKFCPTLACGALYSTRDHVARCIEPMAIGRQVNNLGYYPPCRLRHQLKLTVPGNAGADPFGGWHLYPGIGIEPTA